MAQYKTSDVDVVEAVSDEVTSEADFSGVRSFRLTNELGVVAEFINWGARLTQLTVPNRDGDPTPILLAYPTLDDYLEDRFYLGAMVGPYANRIAQGRVQGDGIDIQLPCQASGEHLHSESAGFDRQFWHLEAHEERVLRLSLTPEHGDGGYPGNRSVIVEFRLAEREARLELTVWAETDQLTPFGVSQHSYFNLDGASHVASSAGLANHRFCIPADEVLAVDAQQIPLPEPRSVDNSPMDFRQAVSLKTQLDSATDKDTQVQASNGFDHCWCFDRTSCEKDDLLLNGEAFSRASGIRMRLFSNQPGMQFYSGQWLESFNGLQGQTLGFAPMQGFCMEPQQFPNGPNRADSPTAWLSPSQPSICKMRWAFDVLT